MLHRVTVSTGISLMSAHNYCYLYILREYKKSLLSAEKDLIRVEWFGKGYFYLFEDKMICLLPLGLT